MLPTTRIILILFCSSYQHVVLVQLTWQIDVCHIPAHVSIHVWDTTRPSADDSFVYRVNRGGEVATATQPVVTCVLEHLHCIVSIMNCMLMCTTNHAYRLMCAHTHVCIAITMHCMLMGMTTIGCVENGRSVDVCGSHVHVDARRSHMHADLTQLTHACSCEL